jgi:hypothetical protein
MANCEKLENQQLISLKIGNCDNKTLWELIKPGIIESIEVLINSDIDIVELEYERG